jgi:hypothetical protein
VRVVSSLQSCSERLREGEGEGENEEEGDSYASATS